jgi:hypothetical protein
MRTGARNEGMWRAEARLEAPPLAPDQTLLADYDPCVQNAALRRERKKS